MSCEIRAAREFTYNHSHKINDTAHLMYDVRRLCNSAQRLDGLTKPKEQVTSESSQSGIDPDL